MEIIDLAAIVVTVLFAISVLAALRRITSAPERSASPRRLGALAQWRSTQDDDEVLGRHVEAAGLATT